MNSEVQWPDNTPVVSNEKLDWLYKVYDHQNLSVRGVPFLRFVQDPPYWLKKFNVCLQCCGLPVKPEQR